MFTLVELYKYIDSGRLLEDLYYIFENKTFNSKDKVSGKKRQSNHLSKQYQPEINSASQIFFRAAYHDSIYDNRCLRERSSN